MNHELAVEQANAHFYRALAELDIEAMEEVWRHEDWVVCVHPGWPMMTGWAGIQESWMRIFENTKMMNVSPEDVSVRVDGNVAWVSCIENISTFYDAGLQSSYAQATNVFQRVDGAWKMVVHHASPLPVPDDWEGAKLSEN
jgi:ketosteroid isomerase-like protein